MQRGASGVEMIYFDAGAGAVWCGEDRSRAGPEERSPTTAEQRLEDKVGRKREEGRGSENGRAGVMYAEY